MGDGNQKARRVWVKAILFWWACAVLTAMLPGCEADPPEVATASAPSPAPPARAGTIVAVGDSLTAGLGVAEDKAYPAQLARRLQSDGYAFHVINAGVSGETSSGTLARIQWVISSLRPDIVVLATGANDGLRGLEPELLQRNLDQLITILMANDILVILAGMRMPPNLGPEYTQAFDAIYPGAARAHGVALIPFFLEGVAGIAQYNQADKIHPTARGYGLVVDNMYGHVVSAAQTHLARQK